MDIDLDRFVPVSPETEPGMNLISSDFDLIMVNRVNERLYGKPMVELLGRKCYREFEKREEPCPHCPGRLSLVTGESHVAETEGLRDDGTWFSARIRTHPVQGPGNQPTGFIEVVEDITEEKRAEKLARIDADLQTALTAADTVPKALSHTLDAALKVEGIDAGCVFSIDWSARSSTLVCQRNLSPDYASALLTSGLESATSGELPQHLAHVPGAPRASEMIPIVHRGRRTAVLVAAAYVYPAIPPSLKAGLHGLGATAGHAISRILAERSRGDAVADLEAFITVAPLPTWLIDREGRVTMWNRAAADLLGWDAAEILGRGLPLQPGCDLAQSDRQGTRLEATILAKDGRPVDVRLTIAPFRDVVGNATASIVMAEDLTLRRRVEAWEAAGSPYSPDSGRSHGRASDGEDTSKCAGAGSTDRPSVRVLVVDSDPDRSRQTVADLTAAGLEAASCGSLEEAADVTAASDEQDATPTVVFAELIGAEGTGALEVKARLRACGRSGPVVVCSDADVLGYEFHGFAASLKRPYSVEDLKRVVERALATSTG